MKLIIIYTLQQRRDDCKFRTIVDPNEMEVSSVAEAIQQSAQGPSFSMPALPAAINNSSPATKPVSLSLSLSSVFICIGN
jgi:hypothetical protein